MSQERPSTLTEWGRLVLLTPNTNDKATLTLEAETWWKSSPDLEVGTAEAPDIPARPNDLDVVDPKNAPRRGKGGNLASRQAIIHSIVHIEGWAIDLSWDILVRFCKVEGLPREFFDDWLRIAAEEAKHYSMLSKRLGELGSSYGE